MPTDKNVRSLLQVMMIAKSIIDAGRAEEFVKACSGRDDLFVLATEAAREFMATFLNQNSIDPSRMEMRGIGYGQDRCS
ncbi:hypothetical protein [Aureimonas phyllosphaerae]|uniref:Uncharacterized protein n=1 Tax=Aureimonas phyllosphaerae TaxID=1166078 RepID=A0A7W6FWN4_9HYPH|nr:hypothetical protein [Aureimonas phyllosphaerae]MBB3937217.1 hypothetical protein [Aureimonas phyllosphaerae]MBB3961146.1 hypothetical protein [Aureimonas phyllosphaerae]SFF49081.1 hypothetical protein SAMN05216566_11745 [Aureimonas phyllosphaerae]